MGANWLYSLKLLWYFSKNPLWKSYFAVDNKLICLWLMWLFLRWQELAHCRDSRSTISGGRGGGGGSFDYLGRPVLNNNSRRGRERPLDRDEESRLRVESYVRNSNMSLVSVFLCRWMSEQVKAWFPEMVECISRSFIHISLMMMPFMKCICSLSSQQETRFQPPLIPSTYPIQSTDRMRHLNGGAIVPADGISKPGSVNKHAPLSCSYPRVTDDEDEVDEGLGGLASQEHPDDQDSETNNSHVSDAHPLYQNINGSLRPKSRLSPTPYNPHATVIHKAQIV